MTPTELYNRLNLATTASQVEEALGAFESDPDAHPSWVPYGSKENNRGVIEITGDSGRALVERVTNGIDAVLEAEFEAHHGNPDCRSPKEAARAWLGVPDGGLSELSQEERRRLAQRVVVRINEGEGRDSRVVEIRDYGIGLTAEEMPRTILSLNESNKIQKYYVAGTYGQGGSGTLAVSKYTLVASRRNGNDRVGFTIAKFLDLPPEVYKTGHYVYLTVDGGVPEADVPADQFKNGTLVRHFGYELTAYPSPVGPNSIYGLLNQVLFDPVIPIWLDNPVNTQRRVIKGSRNALNGAVDEGDEQRHGPTIVHNERMFYTSIGEFGRLGIEYWVLAMPSEANKRPSAAFVNPSKPILMTVNGQNHSELSASLIRKDAGLPYLASRLICHINCDGLTALSKRALFVSTREEARRGAVLTQIQQELIHVLRSDDDLVRLNEEARLRGLQESDENALRQMRREVARLLRLQGNNVVDAIGAQVSAEGASDQRPTHPRVPRPRPVLLPIEPHDPPTFIHFVGDGPITFHTEQRKYIRIETDASSRYHNPNDPNESRINVFSTHGEVTFCGSTPLQGGRMRAIFECSARAQLGSTGTIRVELSRPGLPVLSDEKQIQIVAPPPVREDAREIALPEFDVRPVEPESEKWLAFDWPDDTSQIASESEEEDGKLVVYYSTVFPPYRNQLTVFEARDPGMASSFTERYKIWLAVHALLIKKDQQAQEREGQAREEDEAEVVRERRERCRMATMAAFFARNEVQNPEVPQPQQEP